MRIFLLLFFITSSVNLYSQQIQLPTCHCFGNGKTTMVFDAGMGNWSIFFQPLVTELSKITKICLIDRLGYSSKSKLKTSRDAHTISTELNQVLLKNEIRDSIILIGHSLGGLNVRMFQSLYPEKIIGMILLDAAPPQLYDRIPDLKNRIQNQIVQTNKIIKLAKWGLLRFAKKKIPTLGLPKQLHKEYYKITTRSWYYITYQKEMEMLEVSLNQCKHLPLLGNLPLLVVSSSKGLNQPINSKENTSLFEKEIWVKMQRELTSLSTNSTYFESRGDHFLQLTDTKNIIEQITKFYKNNFN